MNAELLPWIILFLPLLAAALITLFTRRDRQLERGAFHRRGGGRVRPEPHFRRAAAGWAAAARNLPCTWLAVGDLQVDFGLRLDPLSLLMMLVVTGVASAIHIYSWGYMREDPGFSRFFACLSLFTFSMLGIVLANNFVECSSSGNWSASPAICSSASGSSGPPRRTPARRRF